MIESPALRYYGGKWQMAQWIIGFFPPHENYLEPCGGAASVLLRKTRSRLETYNDLDGNVVNFFRVLRDRRSELEYIVKMTPWSREEYNKSQIPCDNELESARRFYVNSWMAIGGECSGWRTERTVESRGGRTSMDFQRASNSMQKIADRLIGVQIENDTASRCIDRYDSPQTLIYFDPPYTHDTRAGTNRYKIEQDTSFHEESAKQLRSAHGFVIVSGYRSALYDGLYEGWQREDKIVRTNSGGKRIESLWINPRAQSALGQMSKAPRIVESGNTTYSIPPLFSTE